MNRYHGYVLFFLLLICMSGAQISTAQYYVPSEVLQAVEKGTRTRQGIPGEDYFQNRATYEIFADIDPDDGLLKGHGNIVYYNLSPDTLSYVCFRLYQNIAKKGSVRDEAIPAESLHNGVRISRLKVDGQEISGLQNGSMRIDGTVMQIFLPEELEPGDSVLFEIRWRVQLPMVHLHRFGRYGESTHFVGYWYPQIAVYDDIEGWDTRQYTGTHEFYHDFSDYDVSIRVPAKYMVWATGIWQNPEDILSNNALRAYRKATTSNQVVQIITESDLSAHEHLQHDRGMKFHFRAEQVPDFAFGVSDRYVWDAVSVVTGSDDSRTLVSAVYPAGANFFDTVAGTGAAIIRHFSDSSYGIPFPFPVMTVFNGEGGMEYPMIVNNGATYSHAETSFLTMHEIAHTYLPFLAGINERLYSWVDEGLTTWLPVETEMALHESYYTIERIVSRYDQYAGTFQDIPLHVAAYQSRDFTYQVYSYIRSAAAWYILEQYMGREAFRNALKEFFEVWKYKHPTAYDLLALLETSSGKDLDWIYNTWFFGSGYADLGIEKVVREGDSLAITIVNHGGMPVPVNISLLFDDGEQQEFILSMDIWKDTNTYTYQLKVDSGPQVIELGSDQIPDKYPADNHWKSKNEKQKS